MKKKLAYILLILLMILPGCTENQQISLPLSQNAVTFTDDLGREVTVDTPEHTAALLGSFAQVWMLAGGTVAASADDAWNDLHLSLPEDAVNLGNTKNLSLEKLLACNPDFIIASTNTRQHIEWRDTLESTGIPTAYFDVADFDGYLRLLSICTEITGRPDLYQQYGIDVQAEIEQVIQKGMERTQANGAPKVLSLRASAASIRAKNSEGNVLGEMLKQLGCDNIADRDNSLLENLSMEHILEADPDYIFVVQQGDDAKGTRKNMEQFLADHPAWSQLAAVKKDKVFYLDKALFGVKPNHRWGEAYQMLEDILENE